MQQVPLLLHLDGLLLGQDQDPVARIGVDVRMIRGEVPEHTVDPCGERFLCLPLPDGKLHQRHFTVSRKAKKSPLTGTPARCPIRVPPGREKKMVGDTGLEPVTPCMSSRYSNHLS